MIAGLAPLVEDYVFILDRLAGKFQLADCVDNPAWAEVACGVIVFSDHKETRVSPRGSAKQDVKILKVVIVECEHGTRIEDCGHEMQRIPQARVPVFARHPNVVPCLPQQLDEQNRCGIIINIEPH